MPRRFFRAVRAALFTCSIVVAVALPPRPALAVQGGRRSVEVLVPEAGNLQLLAFWVALGGGYFGREGLDVRAVTPDPQTHVETVFAGGQAPVAILSGPEYERLIAAGFPFQIAANLLQNDPLELVMRREVANRLHLHEKMPLRRRLEALRSVSLGVTIQDRARLYALFHSEGLDANSAQLELRTPEEMLDGFVPGQLDVIYTQTPYVERALLEKDGMVLVDAAAGDVPSFSDRMIQALAVTRTFAATRPEDAQALVRAVAKAEHVIHAQPALAVQAVEAALPKLDPRRVARAVSVYSRAVPPTPHVEALLIKREAAFYPVGGTPLDLSAAPLDSFVLASNQIFHEEVSAGSSPRRSHRGSLIALSLLLVLGMAFLFLFVDQRGEGEERNDVQR
jgi:ABC-type nitrate/sulfonate/bicarbonate transport system substrate-binding protein